jgi:uncharacterized protein
VKIDISRVSQEKLTLKEEFSPQSLELETGIIKLNSALKATAEVSRITNAVTILLSLEAKMRTECSRCLEEIAIDFKKKTQLSYSVDSQEHVIDLDPQIREEVILDYPLKPLCKADCMGLCPKCGKNLNEGKCGC